MRMTRIMAMALLTAGLGMGVLAGCATTGTDAGSSMLTRAEKARMDEAIERIKPSIVRIKVVEPEYYGGRADKFVTFGSGTIITPEGHVVTNHHVAGKAVQLVVTLPNREEVPATLVGTDPATDIAVIKLHQPDGVVYPTARFGNSDTVRVGDPVLALGSPAALSQSVTLGIVSNTEMIMPEIYGGRGLELDGESVGQLVRWFGHDAQIFGGNSGGPLVNLDGEIIGVNEIGIGGLGGAIPGNLARKVAEQLMEQGRVTRAYLGLGIQPLLKQSGLNEGVLISTVQKNSPAEAAGIEPGDVLLSINGTGVIGRFGEDLPTINNILADLAVEQPSTLQILRAGERRDITIVPAVREPSLTPTEIFLKWGITGRDVSLWNQIALAREDTDGVLITSTSNGGPAARSKPEIKPADVIVQVNDTKIENMAQLLELTESLTGNTTAFVPVLVTFEREGETMMTAVRLGIEELPPPAREVRKAWLPISTQPLTTEIRELLPVEPSTKGVRITRVFDSAGESFPLQVGDIVTELDGDLLDIFRVEDSEVFDTLIRQYRIGDNVELAILRGGERQTVQVTLDSSPQAAREMERYRDLDFEFTVRTATHADRMRPAMRGVEFGAVVDSVTSGGWAALAGLSVGNAILSINGTTINSVHDVQRAMETAKQQRAATVVFYVRAGTGNMFLELEPNW